MLRRTDQDLGFWLGVIAAGPPGRVLELACGTGRLSVPLADAGIHLVGLDIDPAMLVAAAARRGRSRWPLLVAADMRSFALATSFAVVVIAYNSIQLLTEPADAVACLRAAAAHLSPGGIVGLEATDFRPDAEETDVASQLIHSGTIDGRPVALWGALSHEPGGRISRYRRCFVSPAWTVSNEIAIRSYRRDELAELMAMAGLSADRWWVDGAQTRVVARRVR